MAKVKSIVCASNKNKTFHRKGFCATFHGSTNLFEMCDTTVRKRAYLEIEKLTKKHVCLRFVLECPGKQSRTNYSLIIRANTHVKPLFNVHKKDFLNSFVKSGTITVTCYYIFSDLEIRMCSLLSGIHECLNG